MLRASLLISMALVSAGFAGSVCAETGLLNGSLGQWLDGTAAPQLAELLSRHPKFKGETVRFVTLRNGQPMATGNRLVEAVEQRLTQQLLRREGVRLAWRDAPDACAAPQKVPYLLGLEVHRDGSRAHRLNIAMVDVEEGVWVSGVSLSWKGRLSAAERAALTSRVESGAPGSAENPLPVRQGTQISGIMRAGLSCSVPGGLDGPLYIETPTQADLAAVAQSLARAISVTPLAAITPDRSAAEWVMALEARSVAGGSQELVLTLQDTGGAEVVQQVASVFVTGLEATKSPQGSQPVASKPLDPPSPRRESSPALLTRLALHDARSEGICDARKARVNSCVEVGFELLRPAYLLVLSTQDQRLRSQSCGRSLRLAEPGERRYRLRIPPGGRPEGQPDAGLYVLAVEDRSVAYRFASHLNSGPGACSSSRSGQSMAAWLRGLDELLRRYEPEVEWRAAHLRHSTRGIVRL